MRLHACARIIAARSNFAMRPVFSNDARFHYDAPLDARLYRLAGGAGGKDIRNGTLIESNVCNYYFSPIRR